MQPTIYQFYKTNHEVSVSQVGGKGYSLIQMAMADLNIPPGFVLSVEFFNAWINALKSTPQWQGFLNASDDNKPLKINPVKEICKTLQFSQEQQSALDAALAQHKNVPLFAVRSSSPEEDLAGASFAGGYETVLGVTPTNMHNAIRQAFASCLDPRVFTYKKAQGFATDDFSIAIVVMQQIASDIAGVGFSVNPITNDYDEAVFNSNWGLGETVVSGLATPDQFIVNKVERHILERSLGAKETSSWLLQNGGTEEHADARHDEFSLTDKQVLELCEQLKRVEDLYQQNMDIEWAYADGELYLLQARPITTYIPLPSQMITQPGEKRRLYLDLSLAVQALNSPVSVMSENFLQELAKSVSKVILGDTKAFNISSGMIDIIGGRIYANLSNILTMTDSATLGKNFSNLDYLSGTVIKELDENYYRAEKKPLKISPFSIFRRAPSVFIKVLVGAYIPKLIEKRYRIRINHFVKKIDKIANASGPIVKKINLFIKNLASLTTHRLIPPLIIGHTALTKIKKIFANDASTNKEIAYHLEHISQSLPNNITIKMGLDLYQLSTLLDKKQYKSMRKILKDFNENKLPKNFHDAWQQFMEKYGFRGPKELDIATSRYQDKPEILLQQIHSLLISTTESHNPLTLYRQNQQTREDSYRFLLHKAQLKGKRTARKFKRYYTALVYFGGYRENHKYYVIKVMGIARKRVLETAKQLKAQGKIDSLEQIFSLTFQDIQNLIDGATFNVEERIATNTKFIRQNQHIQQPPRIFDSRGKILRPKPQPLKPGELSGQAVSSGKVTGRVKVLHTADEKPLLPGEILVARATDPGWTPLFVNAAAIILEVGGMLQHGALVAREYGKPCVVGIQDATDVLQDGQLIEVDGDNGIIRLQQP